MKEYTILELKKKLTDLINMASAEELCDMYRICPNSEYKELVYNETTGKFSTQNKEEETYIGFVEYNLGQPFGFYFLNTPHAKECLDQMFLTFKYVNKYFYCDQNLDIKQYEFTLENPATLEHLDYLVSISDNPEERVTIVDGSNVDELLTLLSEIDPKDPQQLPNLGSFTVKGIEYNLW